MELHGTRIYLGLSGGVDSAVAAALLQQAGAEITGVFIKGWYPPGMPCNWAAERLDAMRVAAYLSIPFRTLDASAAYKREVIEYLVAEYAAGRTPNPDALCNREIKFGSFYRYALEAGVDTIATGHYRSGEKDQSYFLALVPKEVLAKTVFPLDQMEKRDVRRLAQELGLPVAEKRDSQGVCFLGPISVKEYLEAELGTAATASILHTIGERIGGQYVVGKEGGQLRLSDLPYGGDSVREIHFHSENWLQDPARAVTAQARYRAPKISGSVRAEQVWTYDTPLAEVPAPGQVVAFYDKRGQLVGGGIIDEYAP